MINHYVVLTALSRTLEKLNEALRLFEWVESTKHLEFSNYISSVDLIVKASGISEAETHIHRRIPERISESFRSKLVYCTLLENYAYEFDATRVEELFNKMKKVFPITSLCGDRLLLLNKEVHVTVVCRIVDVGADVFLQNLWIEAACTSFPIVILVFDPGGRGIPQDSGSSDAVKILIESNAVITNKNNQGVSQAPFFTRNELCFLDMIVKGGCFVLSYYQHRMNDYGGQKMQNITELPVFSIKECDITWSSFFLGIRESRNSEFTFWLALQTPSPCVESYLLGKWSCSN